MNVKQVATRKQSDCPSWFEFRKGRITASEMKGVCRTKVENPSICLIKKLCYGSKFYSPYAEWGKRKEKVARELYKAKEKEEHLNFLFRETGLTISESFP